jgi:hypothetical protein
MPVCDLRLAGSPAQVNGPFLPERGKVEETKIEVVDDATVLFYPVDQADDLSFELGELARAARLTITTERRIALLTKPTL